MKTVAQYMSLAPFAVGPDRSVDEASRRMREARVHHLPVLRGSKLVGLVTEEDLHAFEDETPEMVRARLSVEDVMIPSPCEVASDAPLGAVARAMLRTQSSAAVVTEGGEVVGVFTLTDALRALADALDAA